MAGRPDHGDASLAGGVVLLVTFAVIEVRSDHPMLPPRLLKDRNRTASYIVMFGLTGSIFAVSFFFTLLLQTVMGFSPLKTGFAFLPFAVGIAATSQVVAKLLTRIHPRVFVTIGPLLAAIGLLWLSRIHPQSTYASGVLGPLVVLALRELERTHAFDREWLLIDLPTGTGYVNYAAVSVLEMLSRGNCATVAMQYAARPSPLSLDRVGEGHKQARLLVDAISERLRGMPVESRPKVVLFGESLGAWTSQDAFLDQGTHGLIDAGIDYAIWIGTPHFSQWKEQMLRDERADVASELVGVFNDIGEWEATPAEQREQHALRHDHASQRRRRTFRPGPHHPVAGLARRSGARWREIPKGMRWIPITTFFQVLVDMKNSANVVPGVFAATGHDYRADLLPFFRAVLGIKVTDDQMQRLAAWLEQRELVRSQWVKRHGTADKSLAASLVVGMDARRPRTSEQDDHRTHAGAGVEDYVAAGGAVGDTPIVARTAGDSSDT